MDRSDDRWGERLALYSGPDVCRAAGVTYRQLDYWATTGVVEPSRRACGSGSQRGYTLDEAVAVALVGAVHDVSGNLPSGALGVAISGAKLAILTGRRGASDDRRRTGLVPVEDLEDVIVALREHGAAGIVDVDALRAKVTDALRDHEAVAA